MKIFAPDYYKNFRCTASECRHNCCIGWEIDIDADTREYYRSVGGSFGEKLENNIACGECASFILGKDERCPFLNKDNLCDIIITLGEEALCNICRDHPRYRNFFSDRRETGVGLACEAAAKLIVEKADKTVLCKIFDDKEDNDELHEDEAGLLALRDRIFGILQDGSCGIDERLSGMLSAAETELPVLSPKEYAALYGELEYLERDWHDILCAVGKKEGLPGVPREFDRAFEQLAVYFVFRHLANALDDGNIKGTLIFCALGTKMIRLLCSYHISVFGSLALSDVAEYARMYSCEVEYSEENTEYLKTRFI